jgi:small GTP-binding protein
VIDFFERDPCIRKDDIEPASVISVAPAWSGTAMVDDHIKRKILLLGDGAVGKTSLIRRFVVDKFADEYITTIGTKVTKKDLRIESPGKVTDLTFMIWDVLGQKGYKGIQESSFQGAKGALLMYDVTRSETADSLRDYWIPHLVAVTNSIPLVVVGNKLDLADSRRQAQEALDDIKEALGVSGFLSSAKTGQNVEIGFLALAKAIISESDAKMSRREAIEGVTHEFIVVTDQIIMDFCDIMGGQEAAMPIVRQQLTRAGVDVKAPTREGLRLAVDYLAETESSFRNAADVEESKRKRLGWIKEVA